MKNDMTFKEWVIDLFKDERKSISIKPVISFIGIITLCIFLMLNIFLKNDLKYFDTLLYCITYITIASLTGDTADKFSFKNKITDNPIEK